MEADITGISPFKIENAVDDVLKIKKSLEGSVG
jgi:hypothetical protein